MNSTTIAAQTLWSKLFLIIIVPSCWISFRSKAVSKARVLRLSVLLINILTTGLYSLSFDERCLSLFRQYILHFGSKGDLRFLSYDSITIYGMLTLYLHWKKCLAVNSSSFVISQVPANRSKRYSPMYYFHFFDANSSSIRILFVFCRWQKYEKNGHAIIPECKKCDFVRILIDFKLFVRNVQNYHLVTIPTRFPVKRSCACAFITIASQTIATYYIMPISATIFLRKHLFYPHNFINK